jgi:hypothetical protein
MAKILMMSERRVIGTTPIFVMQRLRSGPLFRGLARHGLLGRARRRFHPLRGRAAALPFGLSHAGFHRLRRGPVGALVKNSDERNGGVPRCTGNAPAAGS